MKYILNLIEMFLPGEFDKQIGKAETGNEMKQVIEAYAASSNEAIFQSAS